MWQGCSHRTPRAWGLGWQATPLTSPCFLEAQSRDSFLMNTDPRTAALPNSFLENFRLYQQVTNWWLPDRPLFLKRRASDHLLLQGREGGCGLHWTAGPTFSWVRRGHRGAEAGRSLEPAPCPGLGSRELWVPGHLPFLLSFSRL